MKVLLVAPEVRMDSTPTVWPFWAGIFAAIVEKKGGQVGILDLNALRMKFDGSQVPIQVISDEISAEKWDLIGIGGLTTTYGRIKELCSLIKKCSPHSLLISGGGWATYNPDEILQLVPELDLICIGEGEETFSEIYDEMEHGTNDFEKINGLCMRDGKGFKFTAPRALIDDLDTVPFPAVHLFEHEIYFKYSRLLYSVESFNAKRRACVCWERGCPRGCTFCSHNGMSRIDLQNIYGSGDRQKGEKLVRISDEQNDTFQLPARWPTPEYAINSIKALRDELNVDFISIVDENMTSNRKWTEEFCRMYIDQGLSETIKWGTLGDAPSVAVQPSLVKTMIDAGCCYISFGFESASDKVLKQDIQKGQTRAHLQKTIDTIKGTKIQPVTTFMIGNMHETIDDFMETVDFWIQNDAYVDPFICTPYVGSPIFYENKDYVLAQYDERLKLVNDGNAKVDENTVKQWKLQALDKFMKECGNALDYTATISQYFTIPELFSIKRLMYKHDTSRLLQWAHQRYDQTGLDQWKHSKKWKKYCQVCKSVDELSEEILSSYKQSTNFHNSRK